MSVVSAHDVAAYILSKRTPLTGMKLQKLLYYSQAWSLVFDDAPLFADRIEAWANGPVVPVIYQMHKGEFSVKEWPSGNAGALSTEQGDTVDSVLEFYGPRDAQWLSDLTHLEDPWKKARVGLPPGSRSDREITLIAMYEYYSSLPDLGDEQAR
jgi:uncharacterized phage-associated protein